jgi:hypothetical protein
MYIKITCALSLSGELYRHSWRKFWFFVRAHNAALAGTTSAMSGRSILQRPWRTTRPCRRLCECIAVGAGCLACAQACAWALAN